MLVVLVVLVVHHGGCGGASGAGSGAGSGDGGASGGGAGDVGDTDVAPQESIAAHESVWFGCEVSKRSSH